MTVLILDTSATVCAAGIYCEQTGALLSESSELGERGHAEKIISHVDACLADAETSYSDLSKIAVTIGPGSFTGVRVGLSLAKGLSIGLNVPITAISTLDAGIAEAKEIEPNLPIACLNDAKRDQVFFQIEDEEPEILFWKDIFKRLEAFEGAICGSAAEQFNDGSERKCPIIHSLPTASLKTLGKLASSGSIANLDIQPIYLRSADAKKQVGAALPRV